MDSVTEKKIVDWLREDNAPRLILVGIAGVGKTWTAKKIRECAITMGYAVLWVSMTVKHDNMSLYKIIAHQLSLLSTIEKLEEDDIDEEKEESSDNLKKKVSEKLKEIREENKPLLLILDDEEPKRYGSKDLLELEPLRTVNSQIKLKILISRRNIDDGQTAETSQREIKIEPLSEEDSLSLLKKRVVTRVSDSSGFGKFSEAIAVKSKGLPAAIILMAEALNQVGEHELDGALEEAAKDVSPLLHCAYGMLPSGVVTDCFWHCREFFHNYGGLHYNKLITYWIMEGYFDPVTDVEKAYEKGHSVLMQLLNRRMLKIQEDNIVILEGATQSIVDNRLGGFSGTANLGLTSLVPGGELKGLDKITPMDGMIKTLCSGRKWKEVHALLIHGSCLLREVPEKMFQRMDGLEVLAVFDLKLKQLPSCLSQLKYLHVLVLRGCDLLDNIDHISQLKKLTVLEISGASSLTKISDDFFAQLTQLQSLNLSGSQLQELPSTISKLIELRWLILRRCKRLESLPKIHELSKLEVFDLSDATLFNNVQEKSFTIFKKLKIIDLSNTRIVRLPFISDLKDLTRILLRGCTSLSRLPKLENLPRLQILDLSDAVQLKEINALKFLDQSGITSNHSASCIGNLSELYLMGCHKLKELPCTENLTGLRVLDLSDASSLGRFIDKSFNHLSLLHSINLSKTKVKSLPSLSELHNLCFLLLRGCLCLEQLDVGGLTRLKELDLSGCENLDGLQGLNALQKLEVLDLSGCVALPEIQVQSFLNMSRLRKLNLSATKVESLSSLTSSCLCQLVLKDCTNLKILPSSKSLSKLEVLDLCGAKALGEILSELCAHMIHLQNLNLSHIILQEFSFVAKFTKLRQLSLECCRGLATVPFLTELTGLEILDLSETDVCSLSSLEKLSHLSRLLLRKCSRLHNLPSLKSLIRLEVLDISESGVKEFPYEISELAHLKHLYMTNLKVKVDWERIKRLPGQFDFSNLDEIDEVGKNPSILVNGTEFFQNLKKYDASLLKKYLKQFFFCICPPIEKANGGGMYLQREDIISNDAYFDIREFPRGNVPSIELCGFEKYPTGVEYVLEQTECISLVENGFMKGLSSLGSDTLKLKHCWLERCTEMENIFSDHKDVKLGENLEVLWVSNLTKLKSLCSWKVGSINLNNLQHLHVDCCPMLEEVFPLKSGLENLKIMKIKFCERLKMVFKCDGSVNSELPKLQELHLFELPELTHFGARYPCEVKPNVFACPNLKLEVSGDFSNGQNASAQNAGTGA
ncbi:PREDICTED: putative disease resistance protein At4g19050 isoform X2 [Populus euphratica]|nr:PREDICTED: putative disease resistance protein At4g19050 isoform X2 [Populus euphratica]